MSERFEFSRAEVPIVMAISFIVVWLAFMPTVATGYELGGNIVGDGCPCGGNNHIQCPDDDDGVVCPSSARFYVCSAQEPKSETCVTDNTSHPCHSGSIGTTGCGLDDRDQQSCGTITK